MGWYRALLLGSFTLVASVGLGGCVAQDEEGDGIDQIDSVADTGIVEQQIGEQCGHSLCEVGPAVPFNCDTCVGQICAVDSFCCTSSWDGLCVSEVTSICGLGPVAVTSSTSVSAIKVRVRTGTDDLRGGSQAYGSFQLASGVSLPKASLNNGVGFPGSSVNIGTIGISPARTLGSLKGFTLEWDGAPRNWWDTYDNWDANELRFFVEPLAGHCPTLLGAPVSPGRMTGSRTLFSTAITFP